MPYKQVPGFQTSSNGHTAQPAFAPDPEVKPSRRRYPVWYKFQVLKEADACKEEGEIGALLRREGLYHCTLTHFRRQRAAGMLGDSRIETPAAKASRNVTQWEDAKRTLELERENRELRRRLHQAEVLLELQKKVAELLGHSLEVETEVGSPDPTPRRASKSPTQSARKVRN